MASCVMVMPQGNMVLHLPMDDHHFGCVIFFRKKPLVLMDARLNLCVNNVGCNWGGLNTKQIGL